MIDRSYTEALEAARGHVSLGPAPCHTCGAWVEYAGGAWVALASDQLHECEPFLQAEPAAIRVASSSPSSVWEGLAGPLPALARYQAHELPEPEPAWVEQSWRPVAALATLLVVAFAVEVILRAIE